MAKDVGVLVTSAEQSIGEEIEASRVIHLAVPVRWSLVAGDGRGPVEMACTYDIHPRGARLIGVHNVQVGDLVQVERGRNRAICQVVWTGDRNSPLRGQFSVRCVEGKAPWEEELKQAEEDFLPLQVGRSVGRPNRGDDNRRRRPRYLVEGKADLIDGMQRTEGIVQQFSEFGARIDANQLLQPGTDFRLMLNILDVNVGLKARVKYHAENRGMGVEFQEIRRGDRPLLEYVLKRLRARRVEEAAKIEVAPGNLNAGGGLIEVAV